MAPVFFLFFMWGTSFGLKPVAVAILLWILFVLIELSDLFDGKVARGKGIVSSFGKLFDPFADVVSRVTYFICFAFVGIMPLWMLVIILYREFGQLFLRQILAERGIAMAARPGGKIKAFFYMLSGAASLFYWSIPRFNVLLGLEDALLVVVRVLYVIAVVLSVGSFIDYLFHFKKLTSGT